MERILAVFERPAAFWGYPGGVSDGSTRESSMSFEKLPTSVKHLANMLQHRRGNNFKTMVWGGSRWLLGIPWLRGASWRVPGRPLRSFWAVLALSSAPPGRLLGRPGLKVGPFWGD